MQAKLLEDLELASGAAAGTPVFIGSGADWENVGTLMQAADGVQDDENDSDSYEEVASDDEAFH